MNISVAGILQHKNKVFLMRRLPGGDVGGCWEFPGGKCEAGESPPEALEREWLEETGLSIRAGKELGRGSFEHKGRHFILVALQVSIPEGSIEPTLIEHDAWCWVKPAQIPDMDLPDSDRLLFDKLRKMGCFGKSLL